MPALAFLKTLSESLLALGVRRLVALGLAAAAVFVLVGTSSYLLSRPVREVLYSGLDMADVTAMGAALGDAGIDFDVNEAGDTVLVARGSTAKARMYLAQRGLPRSGNSGYELFDKLGSMGLTSFMQQVTKVRALEGELARTIQLIDGIKAARVHLAMTSDNGFRGVRDKPAASVIIRGGGAPLEASAKAIRHLVAAAIPGLSPEQVTIMSTDGTLLSELGGTADAAPERLMGLEREVAADIERNIMRTLSPYVGMDNLRVSVAAKLNSDRREISETKFDPESRVERSVRTVKESGEAENANRASGVSVDQNMPQEEVSQGSGDSSKEKKDRREELTNYEINSRSVATTSQGYGIERLSVAVVIDKGQLLKLLGDGATSEQVEAQVDELKKLVKSAAGLDDTRGDLVELSAVDFGSVNEELEAVPPEGILGLLAGNIGILINAATLIGITLLVLLLGLRPAVKRILPATSQDAGGLATLPAAVPGAPRLGLPPNAPAAPSPPLLADPVYDDIQRQLSYSPRDRLTKIVELDPDRAADVLRKWLNEPDRVGA